MSTVTSQRKPANVKVRQYIGRLLQAAPSPWVPIVLATLITIGLCVFGDPVYQINDDPFLAMVGSGFGVATHPEPHLVWSHIAYGYLLMFLTWLVGPNAQGWATIAACWLSLLLMIEVVLRAGSLSVRAIVFVVCLGCVYLSAILSAEFTVTSTILFGAGIAICFASMAKEKTPSKIWIGVAVLAFIWSYMLRHDSYLMGLVVVGPALLFLCVHRSQFTLPGRWLALVLVGIAVLGFATDQLAYLTSPQWRQVPHYFDLASNFTDFNTVPWIPGAPEYQHVGWSHDDWVMFSHWYTREPIYSAENLSFLIKRLSLSLLAVAPARIWAWFSLVFSSWYLILILACQAIICLLLTRQLRLLGIFLILGELAAMTAVASTGRIPLSYLWQAAAGTTLLSLCGLLVSTPNSMARFRHLGLVLAGFIGLSAGLLFWSDHLNISRAAAKYRHWIVQNRDLLKGKVTVWDLGLMWEWLITPTRIYPPFPQLKVASIDDVNGMPIEAAMLKELGIDDLAKELCTDPDMRLLCPRNLIGNLAGFCEQHHGIRPAFREAATWSYQAIYVLDNPQSSNAASK
jgi:hypothetical protein